MKKIFFFIFFFTSCQTFESTTTFIQYEKIGFAEEVKNENFKDKLFNLVSEKNIIIHSYLEKDTLVKITNLSNKKSFDSIVSEKKNLSSLTTKREVILSSDIFKILDLTNEFPLIKIESIKKNPQFVAGKAEIFEDEKKVSSQIKTDTIEIVDISKEKKDKKNLNAFYVYYGDFAFKDFADKFLIKIRNELGYNRAFIVSSNKKFRIIVSQFDNLNSFDDFYKKVANTNFENFNIGIGKV